MSAPLFVTGRKHRPVLNSIGRMLIGVLVFNAMSPLSVLAQDKPVVSPAAQRQLQQLGELVQKVEQAKAEGARSPSERLTRDFQQAQDLVRTLHADARSRVPRKLGEPEMEVRAVGPDMRIQAERSPLDKLSDERRADGESRLREHLRTISRSRTGVRAEFDGTRRDLVAKRVPAEILARHDVAVRDFDQRVTQFERASQAWTDGSADAKSSALADLDNFFKRYPASRSAAPLDTKKLPWRTPEPTTRQPADTQTAWFQNLWGTPRVMLAAAGNVGPISFDVMPELGQAPTEADLAETPETQLTSALIAKAAELGNNPLTIHNWMRNNIDWLPSWGAVQSADETLAKKSGNAHDIASLEIALLRAAKVPARYQYGTIEVDAGKLQNWVGGATKVEAAQQVLLQGGIANRGIVQGGQVSKVRMEHVWVSAYVNWLPGRGAKQAVAGQHVNPHGPHNAWVPLDASYKQYNYTPVLEVKAAVPFDVQALLSVAQQGATSNASEGWVQNLNQAGMQAQFNTYQAQLKTYIDARKPNAKASDVVGKRIIPQEMPSLLAGSLPYSVVQNGQLTAAVPANLQHQFKIELFSDPGDPYGDGGSAILRYQEKTSQLAGKRLTLTYVPATQADANLLMSYLPRPHADGTPVQPTELPSSLPGYLIRLKPQINLDGKVVAQANQAFVMGADLFSSAGFTQFGNATSWDTTVAESHTVGQATAIGLSLQGVSAQQVKQLHARMQLAKDQLAANNPNALSGEQLSGDLVSSAILAWFTAVETHGWLGQAHAGMIDHPGMSYGFFHATVQPIYSWGVIRQVKFPGLNMDIPHQRNLTASKNGSVLDWVAYNRLRGQYMSGLESAVPERLFSDSNQCNVANTPSQRAGLPTCPEGVSAVKAISIAAQAGQKLYTITPEVYSANPNIVQGQLFAHSDQTKGRVQGYLDAGWEVTIHQAPIAQSGWTGAGFIAIDPSTGAGGYLIDGGSNGGILPLLAGFGLGASAAASMILVAALAPIWAFGAGLLFVIALTVLLTVLMYNLSVWAQTNGVGCFWQGVGAGGFAVGLIAAGFGIAELIAQLGTLVSVNLRAALANAIYGFISMLLFGAAGLFAPSNPIQDCV